MGHGSPFPVKQQKKEEEKTWEMKEMDSERCQLLNTFHF